MILLEIFDTNLKQKGLTNEQFFGSILAKNFTIGGYFLSIISTVSAVYLVLICSVSAVYQNRKIFSREEIMS
jgi:hypothetical protein